MGTPLFSWFLLANHDRYARLVGPGILLGIAAIIAGLALFVVGFF